MALLKTALTGIAIAMLLSACATRVPVTDTRKIDPDTLNQALQIRTYVVGQTPDGSFSVIQPIEAYSCKHLVWEKPASKGDALNQLKYKAHTMGANAIMDVEFDKRGTDAWGTNCWETVQATGVAIKIKQSQ